MKKILVLILIVHCTLTIEDCTCQWQPDFRLTNNSSISYVHSKWCVASSLNFVHAVWYDDRTGNREIYYKNSTNNGSNWGADIRLTNNSADFWYPTLSVYGSAVHVVWYDVRDGNSEIYYKRSTDGGLTWGADTRLTNNTAASEYPSVAISGLTVHAVWQDRRDGNYEIYYKQNPNGNVGIQNITSDIPKEYKLMQNYPNPFNPSTKIKFEVAQHTTNSLSRGKTVSLKVLDILGREIATLVNERLQPGTYEVTFDGSNLPSGIYFYQLRSGVLMESKKLILIK